MLWFKESIKVLWFKESIKVFSLKDDKVLRLRNMIRVLWF